MYHVPLAIKCIYGYIDEGGENGDEEEGSEISGGGKKTGNCLTSCMRMTWLYVVSRRRI